MKIIDLHQDLMSHIRFRQKFGQSPQTDFDMLAASNVDLTIATAFPLPDNDDQLSAEVNKLIEEELLLYNEQVELNGGWKLVLEPSDLDREANKLLFHVEGLNVFSGDDKDWEMLERWYSLGLRSLATHWNIDNPLGAGTINIEGELTNLGVEVIAWAEAKGILLDFAHMGRRTFFDAAKVVSRPIYISHGNSDALCSNIRNYTDEQLKLVAHTGGVIGVFAPNTFVVGKEKEGSVSDLVEHIDYIKGLVGIDHVAIGSDFGGIISGQLEDFGSVDDFPKLTDMLKQRNYTEGEIDRIFYKNSRRIIESHLN